MNRLDPIRQAELLKAYREGSISDQDRHLLEKAALDDDFLFDALQGISMAFDASKSSSTTKVRSLSWKKWIVAASTVGLLLVGYQFMTDSQMVDKTMAVEQSKPSTEKQHVIASTDETYDESPEEKVQEPLLTTESQSSEVNKSKLSVEATPRANQEDATFANKEPSYPPVTATEGRGQQVVVDGTDVRPVSRKKSKISELSKPEASDLSAHTDMELTEEMSQKVNVNPDAAHPKMGAKSYLRFIERHKNTPLEAFELDFKGEVEVFFTILKDGTLTDFEVEETPCKACGDEVIRLLKKGGKWQTRPRGMEMRTSFSVEF